MPLARRRLATKRGTGLQTQFAEDDRRRAEAGERGLEEVGSDKGREKQPIRAHKPRQSEAEQYHSAGKDEDCTVDCHDVPLCEPARLGFCFSF